MSNPSEMKEVKTHCARMDHGGCSIIMKIQGNTISELKGDPKGLLNKGYICPKCFASVEKLNHPDRLRYPLRRNGGRGQNRWKRISWEEALAEITTRFDAIRNSYGAKAVAFCQGMPKGLEHFVLIRLANLFGSPNVVATQDVCHAPREITGLHVCGFYPVVDFKHKSDLVLLWGSNITATNEEGVICRPLLDQMQKGTPVITIDPRRTEIARNSVLHLPIRPGTDLALALGFINIIIQENLYDKEFIQQWTSGFQELAEHVKSYTPSTVSDITWVPEESIIKAARCYAEAKPAALHWGNAIEQTRFNFDTARALIFLMALGGNLDVPGGNIQAPEPPVAPLGKFVRASAIPQKPKEMIHAHYGTIPRLMTVPPAFFRKAVLESKPYPVKGAYFQCTNPLLTWADSLLTEETFKNLEFIVVSDVFLTPTALYADIVLPAATQYEFNDIGHYGLGHGCVLARPKIVDPPEECWPDMKILNELGKRLTDESQWYDNWERLLEEVLEPSGLSYKAFADQGHLEGEQRFYKYRTGGFKTPSGKIEFVMPQADKWGLPKLPTFDSYVDDLDEEYPLVLTSAKDRFYLHSSYRWLQELRKRSDRAYATIHPETARRYDIQEGDDVTIQTRKGSIVQKVKLSETIPPGVVMASYGWWFPEEGAEKGYGWWKANLNMLTSSDSPGKAFGTCNLKGLACRIGKSATNI